MKKATKGAPVRSRRRLPTTTPARARRRTRADADVLHPKGPVTVTLEADHDRSGTTGYPKFLKLLARDTAFRAELSRNPDRVLATFGIKFNPPLQGAIKSGDLELPAPAQIEELLKTLSHERLSVFMGHFFLVQDFWGVITTGGRKPTTRFAP